MPSDRSRRGRDAAGLGLLPDEVGLALGLPLALGRLGLPHVVLGGLALHGLDLAALLCHLQDLDGRVDPALGVVAGPAGLIHRPVQIAVLVEVGHLAL